MNNSVTSATSISSEFSSRDNRRRGPRPEPTERVLSLLDALDQVENISERRRLLEELSQQFCARNSLLERFELKSTIELVSGDEKPVVVKLPEFEVGIEATDCGWTAGNLDEHTLFALDGTERLDESSCKSYASTGL